MKKVAVFSVLICASAVWGQAAARDRQEDDAQSRAKGTAADIGGGVGSVAGGAAKGVGEAAGGVGKGVVDVVTLHPIGAAGAVGTGAVKGGKDVAAGGAKGLGKIGKGVGHAFKKIF